MIRPFIFALVEYLLAYLIYKQGKYQKNVFFWVLFLLATYQLGEVIIFITNGGLIGFRVAYVATTLLPPLGVLLLEKITEKNYGYMFFQLISFAFVVFLLMTPQIAVNFALGQFCVRIFEYNPILSTYWLPYYQGTLLFTMFAGLYELWNRKDKVVVERLKMLLVAYISFNGVSIIISTLIPWFQPSIASLMCALAFIAAFIFTSMSLEKKLIIKTKEGWSFAFLR